jgi:hypothetical protein
MFAGMGQPGGGGPLLDVWALSINPWEGESMTRAATILGILGGLAALVLAWAAFDLRVGESGTLYTMYTVGGFALIPAGVVAIVGAILARRHRSLSVGLLAVAGLLAFFLELALLIVVWRDPELIVSPANIGLLAPGVVTLLAAILRFAARPKAPVEPSGS